MPGHTNFKDSDSSSPSVYFLFHALVHQKYPKSLFFPPTQVAIYGFAKALFIVLERILLVNILKLFANVIS